MYELLPSRSIYSPFPFPSNDILLFLILFRITMFFFNRKLFYNHLLSLLLFISLMLFCVHI